MKTINFIFILIAIITIFIISWYLSNNSFKLDTNKNNTFQTLKKPNVNNSNKKDTIPQIKPITSNNLNTNINNTLIVNETDIINCGETSIEDILVKSFKGEAVNYDENLVLSCLGKNILDNCNPSKGVINNKNYPSIYEVKKDNDICSVRLTYNKTTVRKDPGGNLLANEYIECPIKLSTKEINKNKPGEYAFNLFAYNISGVFMEAKTLDMAKERRHEGCSGERINSFI